jgi:hypothetical protein
MVTKILLLNGTFGINSSKLLLFIKMALNAENKQIPIVFLHFTAQKITATAHEPSYLFKNYYGSKSILILSMCVKIAQHPLL